MALQIPVTAIETVTVAVASRNASVATVTPASLTFTADDWSTGKTVTVTAVDDEIDQDTDRTVAIRHTATSDIPSSLYTGRDSADLTVTVTDDDVTAPGVTTATTDDTATEGSTTDTATFTVVLDTEPSSDVTVAVTAPAGLTLDGPDSATTFTSSEDLTFTDSNWNTAQTVTVRATDDSTDSPIGRELTVTYAVTSSDSGYSGLSGDAAAITVVDNDPTAVALAGAAGDVAEGGTKTFTITLNRGLVNGEALPVPLTFGTGAGAATRGTDYTTACPSALPTGVACANLDSGNAMVTFTGPSTGTTATTVTLTLTAATDSTAEVGGETVVIGLGTLNASSGTGLAGGASGTDSLADFKITDPSAPAAPTSFTATAGNARVALAWADPGNSDISDYQFRQGTGLTTDSTFSWGAWTDIAASDADTVTHTVTGLTNGTAYSFQVRARASGGSVEGTASDTASATPNAPPAAPASLAATAGNTQAVLSWTDPKNDDITKYQVRQGTGTTVNWGEWTDIADSGASTTSHTVTGLTNGTAYSFQVRAVAGTVTGAASNTATATPAAAAPAALAGLTATSGASQITVGWTNPNDSSINFYQLQQRVAGTAWPGASVDLSRFYLSTTRTGLTNGTEYEFRVRAVNTTGNGPWASVFGTPLAANAPDAPTSFTATAGVGQVVLSWADPSNNAITKYQVRQGTGSTTITWGAWADIASSGATTTGHTVTGLTGGTAYSFQVRAVATAVLGAASDTASATPAAPLPRITGLATLASNGTVLLSWTDPNNDDITKYQYRQGTGTTVTWGEWTDMPGDNVFSGGGIVTYSVTGLTNGTEYSFQVRAVVGEMLGEPSDIATETPAILPAKPSGLSAAAGDTKVDLSWTNPLNNAITKYQVQWGTTTNGVNTFGNWMDIAGSGASTTSHTVTGLTNGTAYNFRIRAFVGTAPGTTSDVVSATPVPPPAAPMGLTATGGNQQVVLSWTNPNNASITGYQYQQRTAGSNTWGSLTTISDSNATTTTHTVTGLTNYTEYEFRLRVVNPAGGTNSGAVSATPRPANAPGAPTDFTAVAGPGGGQVTLSWTRPSGTITRQEYRVRSPGGNWPGWTNMRSATITTFVAPVGNEPLEFQMRARNGRVLGVLSAIVPATAVAAPAAPTSVTATAGATQVTLGWADPSNSDITKYQYSQRTPPGSGSWGSWTDFTGGTTAASTSGTVTGLTNGTAYEFRVRATAAAGGTVLGAASTAVTATPTAAATAPAAPAGFTIDTGDTEITLKWIDPDNSDITKYQYRQGTGPLGSITWEDWTDIPNSDADTTEHTVTGLTNGTGYHFRVRVVAGTLNGAATDSTAITPVAKPAAPTGLTATAGATQVTLNWSDPGNATIEKYQMRYGAGLTTDSGFSWGTWADVSSSSATTTSATVTGLTNGTEYSFGVRAVGLSGDGAEATVVATPLAATAPAAPTSLTATAGGGSVTLSWTAPGGTITGYEIRQGTGDPVDWGAWGAISGSDANTTSTTVSSLTAGTAYSFQIRAVNNAVKGAMSDTAGATPVAATVGFKSALLTPTENTNLTVTLVLSQAVSADVDVYLTSTDLSASVTKGSDYAAGTATSPDGTTGTYEVTITAGQTEGSTTIAISDDTIPEERELFQLAIHEIASTVAIARGTPTTLQVIIADDTDTVIALPDPATLTVTEASGGTRTGTYDVALRLSPVATETVTVAVASQDASVATVIPASLTFTADDWSTGKTVTVTGVDDEIDQDTDRTVAIRHTATSDLMTSLSAGRESADLIVTVTDDDVTAPGVTTTQPSDKAVDEADQTDTATFTVVLNTEPSAPVRVSLTPATGLQLSTSGTNWGTSLQLDFATGAWSTAQTVMVRAATDSVDSPSARELAVTWAATSSDTDYSGLSGTAATVTVADDDATTVTLAGAAGDVAEGGTKTFTITLNRGLVNGETLGVPLTFGGDATRNTDYTTACPDTLPTGVTCNDLNTDTTPTVTFTGPATGATARTVTLTLSAATDSTAEAGGESVVIGFGTLTDTGLEGGTSTTDSLADFKITDPDASAPTLEISGVPKRITDRTAFTVTFTFSESVTGFVTGDVTVANGDKSSFTGSGSSYAVVVTPNADADVTVTADADSATDGTNTGPPADVVATAVFGAPAAPSVTATAGNAAVTLTWTDPSDDTITEYEFRQREEGGNWPNGWTDIPNSDADTVSHAVTSLTNGTTYEFQVRAVSDAVDGTPSGTVSATPLAATAPGPPRDLRAAPGGGQVVLNWRVPGTNAGAITKYEFRQGTGDPLAWGAWGDASGTTTSHTVTSLTNGTEYSFQVRAVANTVLGAMSDTVEATPNPIPAAPTNFTATKGTASGAIALSWTAPSGTITRYEYRLRPVGGDWPQNWTRLNVSGVTSFTVGSQTDGTEYEIELRAVNDSGAGAAASATATPLDPTAAAAPTSFTATAGSGQVALAWTAPSGTITKYQVRQGTGDPVVWGAWADITGTTSHTVTSLTNGTEYSFQVRAVTGTSVLGAMSVTATATPTAAPGVTISVTDATVSEADRTDRATFTVVLNTRPSADVNMTINAPVGLEVDGPDNDSDFARTQRATFGTTNWSTAQTVTVRASSESTDHPSSREEVIGYFTISTDTDYINSRGVGPTITVVDNDPTTVTLAGAAGDVAEGATKTFTVTLGRGLVDGETLGVPLAFTGTATRGTDYMTACPTTLPTGVTCNDLDDTDTTPTVTFTGPTTGATARTVTLTLTAATDSTTETGGESVVIGFGTLTATGLEGGTSTTDSLADFSITDPDASVPTVAITGIPAKINNTNALTATFTFSEAVTGFMKNDITVSGGTAGTFGATSTTVYTLGITPDGDANVVVTVAADSATDGTNTGPANAESATAVWDETAPTVEITGVPGKISNRDAFTVTFTFSETVTGFVTGDVSVTNGDKSAFSGSGSSYTVVVTPNADADVTVTVAADGATDGLNTGPANAVSATAVWDETAPTVTITGIPDKINNTNALTATFTFSEAVTGFMKNDITVTGGTAGAFGGSGTTYTLAITPTSGSNVVVTVAANSATDGTNTGPASAESATATWDASVPTVSITGVPARISGTGDLTATFTFSEDVTGFVKNDVTVTGGTTGTFTATSATVYTLVITPDGDANVVVTVDADSATDGLNTGPASAEAATAVWTALVFSSATVTVVEESSATYTVALSSQPGGNVTVAVGGASGEVTFDTDSTTPGTQTTALTFSTTNWSTAQTVTVLAAADNDTANDSATLTHTAAGGGYGSVSGDVEVTVTDNDTPGLVLDPTALTVAEGGSGTYTVKLATQPTGNVTVTVAGASGDVTADTNSVMNGDQDTLTFTTTNWNMAQTVTVSADEDDDTTNDSATLTHSASGGGYGSATGSVAVTVTDDDTAGVTATQPTDKAVDEADQTDTATFTVVLDTLPSANVTVTVTAPAGLELDGPDAGSTFGSSEALAFTTGNWNAAQTVTVRAATDNVDRPSARELKVTYAATSTDTGYSGLTGDAATITVADDDATSVTLTGAAGDVVEGATKDFTIALGRGLVNGETLAVPLTFGGDATRNTDYTTACPTSLPTGVTCNNLNTDTTPAVTFTGPSTGATATQVTLTLTAATDSTTEAGGETVDIDLGTLSASSGTGLEGGASGTDSLADFSITDPDSTAPTVTITGIPDKIKTTTALTATFTFSEAVTDFVKNDITVTGGTAGAFGGSGTTYTLAITPTSGSNVVVTVAANSATDGTNTGPASAESKTATWDAAAPTVEISGVPARISGTGDLTATFTFSEDVTGFVKNDVTVTGGTAGTFTATSATVYTLVITPDGDANVVVTVDADSATDGLNTGPASAEAATAVWTALVFSSATVTVVEESSATYTVALSSQPDGNVTVTVGGASGEVTFDTDDDMAGTQTTALTFSTTNWGTAQTVTVLAAADNDTANDSATLTHTAAGDGYGSVTGDVEVTVTDNDTPGLVLDPTALTVAEGDSGTYTVRLATQPTGTVMVTVAGASGDVTVDTNPGMNGNQSTLEFTTTTWSIAQTVTVSADEDDDTANDSATLTHSASGGGYGSVTGSVAVTVTDDDTAPAAPAGFTAAAGDQQVALSWTDPGNSAIDSWQFRQRTPPGTGAWGSWTAIASSTATTTTHTVTGLTNGTDYGFQVRAVDGTIEGAASAEATATPAPPVTVAFAAGSAAVTVAEGDDSHAELTLELSAARAAATQVRLIAVGTSASASADFAPAPYTVDFPAGDTQATLRIAIVDDNVPEESEAFNVTIVALNLPAGVSVGTPSEATVTIRDDDQPHPAPTDLTATPGAGSVALAWRYAPPAVDRTAEFQYRRGTGDPVSWGAWTTIPGSGPGTRSHTARGLTGGTDYAFQVRARSRPGSGFRPGVSSATARATPAATPEAALVGKVRTWAAETSCADECTADWKRVLKALGETGADLDGVEPMTYGEALERYVLDAAQRARWEEVAMVLRALEVERVVVTIAASPAGPVTEGAELTFTLTAAAAASTQFDLFVTVADAPGSDFLDAADEGRRRVTLPIGETSVEFKVATRDDGADEPDGTVTATVNAVSSVYKLGSPAAVPVQVIDNDGPGAVDTFQRECPATSADLIKTVRGYYTRNRNRAERNFGENWRRVLIAFGEERHATLKPYTAAEARASEAIWPGWRPVREELERLEACPERPAPPPPNAPRVTVTTAATGPAAEGTALAFTLTASAAPTEDLTVAYTVSDAPGADFVAAEREGAKTALIPAGETSVDITVATAADSADEPSGAVLVTVAAGAGYAPGTPILAKVQVTDDDATQVTLAGSADAIAEAGGTKTFTVTLGRGLVSGETLPVPLAFTGAATRGTDYTLACPTPLPTGVSCNALDTAPTPTVTFTGPSTGTTATSVALTLTATEDATAEAGGETVTVGLGPLGASSGTGLGGGASGTDNLADFTITDDDGSLPEVTVAAAGAGVTEGTAASFTLTISPAPTAAVTVQYTVSDVAGSDFLLPGEEGAKTVDFAIGETSKTVTVPTVADTTDEADGPVTVQLTAGDGYQLGAPASARVTVMDDDAPPVGLTVSIGDATVSEGRTMEFPITLSAPAPGLTLVFWRTREVSPVSARQNVDYRGRDWVMFFYEGEQTKQAPVPTVNDAHDEGDETFEVVIDKAAPFRGQSLTITKAVATGTITNSDPLPAAYLARFGRTVAEQALEGIAGRMAAPRTPGTQGTLAGQALAFGPPAPGDAAEPLDDGLGLDGPQEQSSTMTAQEALLGSRFTLTGAADATGGSLAFWGRASRNTFDGTERGTGTAITLDGTVTTGLLGADYARDDWLFGLALTHSSSDGHYASEGASGNGDLEASLTAALPYASFRATPRLKLWGAAGLGAGEVTVKTPNTRYRADTEWTMAAAGLRGDLLTPPAEGAGAALALTADALWTRTTSDRTRGLAASDADVTRLRLGLESSYPLALDGDGKLTPRLEAGARHDGGDAETGRGFELGGGLAFSAPTLGLTLDLSGRTLIAHEDDDLDDRGFSAAIAFDPDPTTVRGPSLALRQTFGSKAEGGLEALFAADPLEGRTGSAAATRWTLETTYGFPALGGRFTASPHAAFGLATDTRETTLGWRLTPETTTATDLTFSVKITRREDEAQAPEHIVGFEATLRW